MAISILDVGKEITYIPVDATKIPYSFSIKLEDRTYKFTFKYNEIGRFYTADLETSAGVPLAYGDILRYGRPLFGPIENEDFPLPVIIPVSLTGTESEITRENFGKSVRLYLFPREGVEVATL